MQLESTATSIDYASLLIDPTDVGIREAADLICAGGIVAFPTETVYGLGANALDENAVLSIFIAKGRPLTDPLIVHIDKPESAAQLVQLTAGEQEVFTALSKAFWPGPLTMITKSSALIPAAVTANTGTVGIRCPAHPIAQRLLSVSGLPIAAPSANRFGHVSPTKACHVLADLGAKGVKVINGEHSSIYGTVGGASSSDDITQSVSCRYGIESTVTKIDGGKKQLVIFRQGAITQTQLQRELDKACLKDWSIVVVTRAVTMHGTEEKSTDKDRETELRPAEGAGLSFPEVGQEAPGQAVTHYAPDVPCYIVQALSLSFVPAVDKENGAEECLCASEEELREQCVVIDYGQALQGLEHTCLAYCDLSPSRSPSEAARNLFSSLRWAEAIPGAKKVLISRIVDQIPSITTDGSSSGTSATTTDGSTDASTGVSTSYLKEGSPSSGSSGSGGEVCDSLDMTLGVADRVFRAASGKAVHLKVGRAFWGL